ncbi:MAG: hypothetical protein MMC23_006562 [Stictis urceolatum]|nr:hypothetical protein [Stictis urceolata]
MSNLLVLPNELLLDIIWRLLPYTIDCHCRCGTPARLHGVTKRHSLAILQTCRRINDLGYSILYSRNKIGVTVNPNSLYVDHLVKRHARINLKRYLTPRAMSWIRNLDVFIDFRDDSYSDGSKFSTSDSKTIEAALKNLEELRRTFESIVTMNPVRFFVSTPREYDLKMNLMRLSMCAERRN